MGNRTCRTKMFIVLGVGVLAALLMVGCALRPENLKTGGMRANPQLSQDMRTQTLVPGYRYYYAGFANSPNAVVGLHPDWTLDVDTEAYLWEPVGRVADIQLMIKNLRWIRNTYEPSADEILDDQGYPIGAFYSGCDDVWVLITNNDQGVFIDGRCLRPGEGDEDYDYDDDEILPKPLSFFGRNGRLVSPKPTLPRP